MSYSRVSFRMTFSDFGLWGLPSWRSGKRSAHGLSGRQTPVGPEFKSEPRQVNLHIPRIVSRPSRGFDGVLFNLWPLANAGFRDAQYLSLLEPPITDGVLLCACAGWSLMALFTREAKLDPETHGARCARAKAVHDVVGISCQNNSGCRPSRVNIMALSDSTFRRRA